MMCHLHKKHTGSRASSEKTWNSLISPLMFRSDSDSSCWYKVPITLIIKAYHWTLTPHHEMETVAVRTCAKFQTASTSESEDR